MKILQINQSDTDGGAAISGYRLHQGLLKQNIESFLLVERKKTKDKKVNTIPHNYRLEKLLSKITKPLGFEHIHHINGSKIKNHSFYKKADIINFHNLHNTGFNYLSIRKLTKDKPAVFTLHDMWSFTGHCAYSYDCHKWKKGCGNCPYPSIYKEVKRDSTKWEWKLKKWIYNHSNLTIVTPSQWLKKKAEKSMLNCFDIHHIPHGINTEEYKPINQKLCRKVLGISGKKYVLMIGGQNMNDYRKGGDLLLKALKKIPNSLKKETLLLIMGNNGKTIENKTDLDCLDLGYINSDRLKSIVFSASDLLLFPTRADNLPLILQESIACGTPIVSFEVGGVPELVRSNQTGYLAEAENYNEFSEKLVNLLKNESLRKKMSKKCREITLKEYSLELQAKRYIELYKKILES